MKFTDTQGRNIETRSGYYIYDTTTGSPVVILYIDGECVDFMCYTYNTSSLECEHVLFEKYKIQMR